MPYTGPLEDRILIRELMETYAHAVMTKDAELWATAWADDAYWALPEFPDLGGFSGKETIVSAWVESMKAYGLDGCTKPMVYIATPGSIEVDGDSAKAVCYTSEIFEEPGTGDLKRVRGRYDDVLAKIDGRWLFTRREYRIFYMG